MPHFHQSIGSISTPYGDATIHIGRYPSGGAIAVEVFLGPAPDDLWTFSTNLVPSGARIADDEFTVKSWSENEELVEPMLATGLFEDTGRRVPSGYVEAPVWRLKDPKHVPPVRSRALVRTAA
jgi:hypothetical protein